MILCDKRQYSSIVAKSRIFLISLSFFQRKQYHVISMFTQYFGVQGSLAPLLLKKNVVDYCLATGMWNGHLKLPIEGF